MVLIVSLFALWVYPAITFLIYRHSRKNKKIRIFIFIPALIISIIAVYGIISDLKSPYAALDILILSFIYFILCMGLWWTQSRKNKTLNILGLLLMILIFGSGYFISTIGVFSLNDMLKKYQIWHSEKNM